MIEVEHKNMATSLNSDTQTHHSGSSPSQPPAMGGLTTMALIVTNSLPILGVLLWGWDVGSVITLYWAENLILGIVTLMKMLQIGGIRALGTMAFFTLHYGMFCAAHGTLIIDMFNLSHAAGEIGSNNSLIEVLTKPIAIVFDDTTSLWWWAFGALCVSHGLSYLINFVGQREFERLTLNRMMSSPYGRILVLHITVLVGGLAVEALGAPVYLLVVLVLAKILADSVMHRREHKLVAKLPAGGVVAPSATPSESEV